jgi:UDPglucose--hexose-1-phosphate uridylyltransferase
MNSEELFSQSHRRFNPLTREWVVVSPNRLARPWQGKSEDPAVPAAATYDPDCYLCPGNARSGGIRNPDYKSTFVFDNDFPALEHEQVDGELNERGLLIAQPERGICRVLCFSERHDLTLSLMSQVEIAKVVDAWKIQSSALSGIPWVRHVQVFENRGALMGASNPHPHCQIWATASIPNQAQRETASQREYKDELGTCLLCDYLQLELKHELRIVCRNEDFVALVPFWAVWPFEIMLLSVRHLPVMHELTPAESTSLADILRRVCTRYDNLFGVPFPYTMGFHQSPDGGKDHDEWHFHAHYYPPLLRSATIAKFMVGYEMLGSSQRDLTPEAAAERLRSASETSKE